MRHALALGLVVAVIALGAAVGGYEQRLLTVAGSYALMVVGYQLVFGHAGALSLAQGAFFGLGAYASALSTTRLGWPFAAGFAAAVAVPIAAAAIVAAPVLRLQSHYFALATLGVAEVLRLAAVNWTELTGGANGISGIAAPVSRGWPMLVLVWLAVAGGVALASAATAGRWGRALAVLRADPVAAAASGVDAGRMRLATFLLSAGFAGAGGALFAHGLRVVSPESIGFGVMVSCLAMTVLGGSRSPAGGIVAALLLVHLPEWFRPLESYRTVAYGAVLLAMIIAAPEGLAGLARRLLPQRAAPTPAPRAVEAVAPRALLINDVAKRFGGIDALAGVSLRVAPGEIVGLIGPNGSGKTTLVNVVSGIVPPDRGRVLLGERDVTPLRPHLVARAGIARTFQATRLPGDMSALELVAAAAGTREGAAAALERAGALEWSASRCDEIPLAARRGVELARALALTPAIVLLDEPAAGLDEAERRALAKRLREVAESGVGLLVVEHDMGFLLPLADRVVCLDRGHVIAEGTPETVRRDPAVIAAFLGVAA